MCAREPTHTHSHKHTHTNTLTHSLKLHCLVQLLDTFGVASPLKMAPRDAVLGALFEEAVRG